MISSLTGLNNLSDISGKLVGNLVNKIMEPGRYSVTWNRASINGIPVLKGIYFIRFKASNIEQVKQIMLVR